MQMSDFSDDHVKLPENAFRELKPGEEYIPVVGDEKGVKEVTIRSVIFGSLMSVLFSAAAAYIALKLGQGIETAIPIAILAIGLGSLAKRKNGLIENVNILAIGATSGIIVGGSVFVMPAIYILGLEGNFLKIFLMPFLGAALGVLFLIPFRKYFTSQMHGKLPFPEATATTEILITGEKGGSQAKTLLLSLGAGFILDYASLAFKTWSDTFTTAAVPALDFLTNRVKAVFAMSTSSAVLGLGYIIGMNYASIIMAGSMLSYFVLIPLFGHVGSQYASLPYNEIFTGTRDGSIAGVKNIGIGCIFAAGIISIIRMSPVIKKALSEVFSSALRNKRRLDALSVSRTDRDIKIRTVVILLASLFVLIFAFFRLAVLQNISNSTALALASTAIVYLIVFLFSSVSAWAIAMISVTPISGMTLTTLIISSFVLSSMGLSGREGMMSILMIGGVVCTALSMSGSLVTQFKIGQWLGATPRTIQISNIIGSAASSVMVTLVIMLFSRIYGYGAASEIHPNPLAAPQASAMAAVASAFMGGKAVPWIMYAAGASIAVIISMIGVSALAFGLGMYLPMELNSPLILGAAVAWFVKKASAGDGTSKAGNERGLLIASGLIAGGALAGVFDGLTVLLTGSLGFRLPEAGLSDGIKNWSGLAVFLLLSVVVYFSARRVKR